MISNYEFYELIKSFYLHYDDNKPVENILKINFGEDIITVIKSYFKNNNYNTSFKETTSLYNILKRRLCS